MRKAATEKKNVTMEDFFAQAGAGEKKELLIIIKADVQGSIEAIEQNLLKLNTEEVGIKILHGAIGGINESDVRLAQASHSIIVGFNVRANQQARKLAEEENIEIRYYSIIYNLIEEMQASLSGLLTPITQEKYLGRAEIREVFSISKVGKVAGSFIQDGQVKRGAKVRLLRDNVVIHEGTLKSLKRFKDEVKEAKEGYECGMVFENYNDIHVGDIVECYEIEEVARTL